MKKKGHHSRNVKSMATSQLNQLLKIHRNQNAIKNAKRPSSKNISPRRKKIDNKEMFGNFPEKMMNKN